MNIDSGVYFSFPIFSFKVIEEKYNKVKYNFYLKTRNFGDKSKHIFVDFDVWGTQKILKLK